MSHTVVLLLLAMLVGGYTTTVQYLTPPSGSYTDANDLDMTVVYAWLLFLIEGVTLMCGPLVLEKWGWHARDGLQGKIGSVLRLLVCLLIIPHAREAWLKANAKVRAFQRPLFILAGTYAVLLPLLDVFGCVFATWQRKYAVKVLHMSLQFCGLFVLARMLFLRGTYFRLSYLGTTDLPVQLRKGE